MSKKKTIDYQGIIPIFLEFDHIPYIVVTGVNRIGQLNYKLFSIFKKATMRDTNHHLSYLLTLSGLYHQHP